MFYFFEYRVDVAWWLFCEAATTMLATIYGLGAVWLVLGRARRALRVCVAVAAVVPFVAISAYDLGQTVLAECVTIVLALMAWRRLRARSGGGRQAQRAAPVPPTRRQRRYQFSLRSLLLLPLLVPALYCLMLWAPPFEWPRRPRLLLRYLMPAEYGIALGAAILVAAWAALARRAPSLRAALVCLIPYAIPAAIWLAVWRRWRTRGDPADARGRIGWGWVSGGLTLMIAGLPAGILAMLIYKAPIPREEIPDPNGYDEIVEAGEFLERAIGPASRMTPSEKLRAAAPALAKVRNALDKPSRVRVDYRATAPDDFRRWQALGNIGQVLSLETQAADAEGRLDDSLAISRDRMRLASAVSRGGRSDDLLHAHFGEHAAASWIYRRRAQLTPPQRREWIELLLELDRSMEPFEDLSRRDRARADRTRRWNERVRDRFLSVVGSRDSLAQVGRQRYDGVRVERRLLAAELALSAYAADRGRLPEQLDQLVPEYLPAVPLDPYSGRPLIYRPGPGGHLLYSVGSDGQDDGGMAATRFSVVSPPGCDITADGVFWR